MILPFQLTLTFGLFLTTTAAAGVPNESSDEDRPPNVVLILADDLGYGDVSCYGASHIETPHIDRLAARGMRFTSGYVASSECAPSRAGLLTGRYPQRCRFRTNADARLGLPAEEITLGQALREVGYRTAAIGKWHLGMKPEHHPLRRGFDEFYGFLAGARPYRALRIEDQPANPIWRNDKPVDADGYLTDLLTDEAVAFVERNSERPFFLYLPYSAPHSPLQAPDSWPRLENPTRDERAAHLYHGLVRAMDDGIGRLMETLAKHGLEENTLFVFLSDNGGTENTPSNNEPFRGGKRDMWEGGLRIPFIVSMPGVVPQGVVSDEPVLSLDIFTTSLALAGATWGEDKPPLDGRDLLPLFAGEATGPVHETIHWMNHDEWAVRRGKWKLVVRDKRIRQLSNLAEDPAETRDVLTKNWDQFHLLQNLHEEWKKTLPHRLYRPGQANPPVRKRKR